IIDNLDPDLAIIKQDVNQNIIPEVVTITDITNLIGIFSAYQGKLIQINDVEFACADVCNSWADAIGQGDKNRNLIDTMGNTVVVRSSGFSDFAGTQLPFGKGSIIGVVSQFGGTIQLTIRNPNEFNMNGSRKSVCSACPITLFNKNFDDNSINSSDWTTQYPVPNNTWSTDNFPGSNYYGVIDNTSAKLVGESWLISPSFDLSNTNTPKLNFNTAARTGTSSSTLKILVSSNYNGTSSPSTATWIDITPSASALSSGSWNWTNSGNLNLDSYKQPGVYIAFKYTGTSSSRDTWEIDDINLIDF
ncbi:MAG: DUF5017 domain-containing protein, partial [Flavobacteriales bacterium]|nr:DUF5017 domain-containing protein [Flavobacteriales bacterium]